MIRDRKTAFFIREDGARVIKGVNSLIKMNTRENSISEYRVI